jgi:hypothetical protein
MAEGNKILRIENDGFKDANDIHQIGFEYKIVHVNMTAYQKDKSNSFLGK